MGRIASIGMCLWLSACAGGGGGANTPATVNPTPILSNVKAAPSNDISNETQTQTTAQGFQAATGVGASTGTVLSKSTSGMVLYSGTAASTGLVQ